MKKIILFLLVCISCNTGTTAQKIIGPMVLKPVFSDTSVPLRSVKPSFKSVPGTRKAERAEREIWNYFRRNLKSTRTDKVFHDPFLQKNFGTTGHDSIIADFEGTPNVNTAIPPDTYGEAGNDLYFHMVNLSFTILSKAGEIVLGPMNAGSIWEGMPYSANAGDGIVLYDDQADRWFIGALCMPSFPLPPYFVMIAVSTSSDPTGSWFRWEYQFQEIPDYPKFGIWDDAYFMSVNRFNQPDDFDGITVAAFERSAMLAGDPSPAMVMFETVQDKSIFSILPADCDGPFPAAGTPGYFMHLGNDFLGVYEFHANWSNPASSEFGNLKKLDIGSYSTNIRGIPQKGSARKLDPISDRLMCRLQFRRFSKHQSMVVNHAVETGNVAGIRWYELRRTTGSWSIYQQSTYAPDSNFRWMGSMAMDSAGNIALGFSVSGYDLFPSVRYTGRMKNDPPGQMTISERSVIEGNGAQTHSSGYYGRWGDYSSMAVDPSDPLLFWYTQQYYPETSDLDWHTRAAAFTFANILDIHATASSTNICPGQSAELDVEVAGGNGTYTYSWSSIPAGFQSEVKNPLVSPDVATKYIVTVSSGVQSKTDTVTIEITPAPLVNAGRDTVCCRLIAWIPLAGYAENYIFSNWQTSGDGTFADPELLSTVYIPGINDRKDSIINLELVVYPQSPCPVISDHKIIRMDTCSGIRENEHANNAVHIYPNPGSGIFTLKIPSGAIMIQVADITGKMVLVRELLPGHGTEVVLNLSEKPPGIYPVRIILRNSILLAKLILQRLSSN